MGPKAPAKKPGGDKKPTGGDKKPAGGDKKPAPAPAAEAKAEGAHQGHHQHGNIFPPEFEDAEEIKRQKEAKDFSGEWGKQVFCRRHYYSMTPIRTIFQLSGRYPFSCSREENGTYSFHFYFYHPAALYFIFLSLLSLVVLILGICNVGHVIFNTTIFTGFVPKNESLYEEQRKYEDVLVKRYFIPLIFVYASLIHGVFAAYFLYLRRHYTANYLTFWSKAVYTMHMDVSRSALGFSFKVLIFFLLVAAGMATLAVFKIGPSAVGLPLVFGDLTFRLFIPEDNWLITKSETRDYVYVAGAVLVVLTFVGSKAAILFFIYHCKLLKSSFAYWNGRVYAAVLRGGEFAQTDEGRTTFKLLFKDHCILMDLMEGLDKVASGTVESYFGCQVFSLFFELYFCIRTAKHGDNRVNAAYPPTPQDSAYFIRPKDWAPGLIMLFVSTSIMFSAAKSAADVAEEAMAGLEVIRRRTMLGRKTDDELYFMLSMFSSYTAFKKMEISAGGYFYMNKDFLIGLISSVLSYFIILYQFQPVMDVSLPALGNTTEDRAKYGMFLSDIEGLEEFHYLTTSTPNPDNL